VKKLVDTTVTVGICALLVVAIAVCPRPRQRVSEQDDAKIKLAGMTKLDSAQKAQAGILLKLLEESERRRVADAGRARAAIRKVEGRLADALGAARGAGKKRTDTVWVTVGTLEDANDAVLACKEADNSCEQNIAAEKAAHELTKQQLARADGETTAARKLIPTPGQQRWHDAKIVGTTLGVLSILKMIIGTIAQ
jgi:hypothetical protein